MPKTTYKEVTTTGPIEWARLSEENRDLQGYGGAYEKTEGAYTVNQILSKEMMTILKDSGSQKQPNQKRIMDGDLVVKFVRPHKVLKKDGAVLEQAGGAPKLTDKDDNPWTEDMGSIGNGSVAECTNLITSFTGGDGKQYCRTSLISVKVLEHVEYVKENEAVGF
tara:strand:+ start:2681 stop:3175 length:495 start_codon:yes stop_codon:yes gene_type:complete